MHVLRILSKPFAFIAAVTLAFALVTAGCNKAAPPATDNTMATALHTRLTGDSALASESIQSSVRNSIATLDGTVSNDAARALAAADAAQVPGIKTVVNNLTVAPPAPPVAAATPAPLPAPAPRESRKPAPHKIKAKPAPVTRHTPKPSEQANVVPLPQPEQNMPPTAPVERRPATPPPPAFRNVTIPSGTAVPVRVTQTLSSENAQIGDRFTGSLANDIVVDGTTVVPMGSSVTGRVSDVQEAAHYKGSSLLSIQLTGINRLAASSAPYTLRGKGRGKNTAEKVGGGAALGAILGGIFGGGKGAAIGAAAGGGVGAGANTITKGEQVQIPSESIVRFNLTSPLTMRVSTGNAPDSGDANPSPALQRRPSNQPPQ